LKKHIVCYIKWISLDRYPEAVIIMFWRLLGITCVGLGALGAVLPLMPTTPFLLLAAWAFSRGSERWRLWLIGHPRYGSMIRAWQTARAIPRRAKQIAILSLLFSLAIALWLALPPLALALQVTALIGVSTFILTRPTAE
jgi:uncharacterized protein